MPYPEMLIFETDTSYGHYQVWDMVYDGRPARVLYSGQRQAAQSGIARDNKPDLLFDYNQRFYELVSALLPDRLLLIGGGMYTLPMALLAALPSLHIDVVELDKGLDDIATAFFDLKADSRLRIIHADGRKYLEDNKQPYDVILLDAFSHDITPRSLMSATATAEYKRNLTKNGLLAANTISAYYGRGAETVRDQFETYAALFETVTIFPASHEYSLWTPQNLILVAEAVKRLPIHEFLRYPALIPVAYS